MAPLQSPAPAAGKGKRQLLPRTFRKGLLQLVRQHSHVFESNPELKPIGVRYFKALLPRRRAGRPCEQSITTASRLFRGYRKRYPTESYSESWVRVYPRAIAGLNDLHPGEASKQKRGLRSAVRARRNASKRRTKAK